MDSVAPSMAVSTQKPAIKYPLRIDYQNDGTSLKDEGSKESYLHVLLSLRAVGS